MNDDSKREKERLSRIYKTSLHIFNNKKAADLFMRSPHQIFEGRASLEISKTERGTQELEGLLWQVYFGLPV